MPGPGFPAARIGDPVTHDGLVPSGIIGPQLPVPCPQCGTRPVLVEGMAAAHVGVSCVCSGATSVGIAHPPPPPGIPPAPIATGSASVFIHGMPAARWIPSGDLGACGVFLGDAKLSAGRTVFIGGPGMGIEPDGSFVTRYSLVITIAGPPEFQATVVSQLDLISTTKSGRTVLGRINASGKSMKIVKYDGDNSFCGPNNTLSDIAGQTPKGKPVFDGRGKPVEGPDGKTQLLGTGAGANTTLELNPDLTLKNPLAPENPLPNDAILMHELNHGAHQMSGQADMSPLGGGWTTQEEKTTILDGDPSEADYLKERGYPYHRINHGRGFAPNDDSP